MEIIHWLKNRQNELISKQDEINAQLAIATVELERINSTLGYLTENVLPIYYAEVFGKYISHIEAYCNWHKINGENPDEEFMRLIEMKIAISENAKKAFREEILLRMSSCSRKGQVFTYKTHDRLREAIEKYCDRN